MQRSYPLHPHDVVAFKTSPCFVDHLWEVFAPLLTGTRPANCDIRFMDVTISICVHAAPAAILCTCSIPAVTMQ